MENTSTKNKLFIHDILKKDLWIKLLDKIININPIIIGIILFIKSIIFLSILCSNNFDAIDIKYIVTYYNKILFAPHFAIALVIASLGFLFKDKKRTYILLGINILISVLFLFDMSYWRVTGTFLSLKHVINPNLFNPLNKSMINLKLIDILFIIDIILFFIIRFFNKSIKYKSQRGIKYFILILILCTSIILKFHDLLDKQNITKNDSVLFKDAWVESEAMYNMTPLGFQAYDAFITLKEKCFCYKLQTKGLSDVTEWINKNKEVLPDNNYKGRYSGKNIIFLQVESLERMVINQKINGQEVTPNLNKLLKNSIYFDNIYEQNGSGSSSDCDLMANTSVLPISDGRAFFEYPDTKFTTMASLLSRNGYTTMSSHPELDHCLGGFNWQEAHKAALNFDKIYDATQLDSDKEKIVLGLSDKSYLEAVGRKIRNLKEPFFNYSITLTSHGPFDGLQDKYKYLDLSENLNKTLLGGYLQNFRYTDEQIGKFIDSVENNMNLKNTVFVIYGDHTILHKNYHNQIMDIKTEENWWKDTEKRIPLIIYTPGQDAEVIDTYGGQIDILPTISYMMGIDKREFEDSTMGRVLVNTERNSTILIDGTIKGEVRNDEEKRHLEDSLQIADKFVRGNYLKWLENKN
ncbi:LTA synthase family protein [Clostridium cagae]|uniref:LTA synthase family protein n=1 Tax=Clostridium cagae TaxID=2080751 RepID=UPI003F76FAE9